MKKQQVSVRSGNWGIAAMELSNFHCYAEMTFIKIHNFATSTAKLIGPLIRAIAWDLIDVMVFLVGREAPCISSLPTLKLVKHQY